MQKYILFFFAVASLFIANGITVGAFKVPHRFGGARNYGFHALSDLQWNAPLWFGNSDFVKPIDQRFKNAFERNF